MIEIEGKKYITTKEASHIFGYSKSWFQKTRDDGTGPQFIRFGNKKRCKIYYDKIYLQSWFLKISI